MQSPTRVELYTILLSATKSVAVVSSHAGLPPRWRHEVTWRRRFRRWRDHVTANSA